jgi:hypothetical protein
MARISEATDSHGAVCSLSAGSCTHQPYPLGLLLAGAAAASFPADASPGSPASPAASQLPLKGLAQSVTARGHSFSSAASSGAAGAPAAPATLRLPSLLRSPGSASITPGRVRFNHLPPEGATPRGTGCGGGADPLGPEGSVGSLRSPSWVGAPAQHASPDRLQELAAAYAATEQGARLADLLGSRAAAGADLAGSCAAAVAGGDAGSGGRAGEGEGEGGEWGLQAAGRQGSSLFELELMQLQRSARSCASQQAAALLSAQMSGASSLSHATPRQGSVVVQRSMLSNSVRPQPQARQHAAPGSGASSSAGGLSLQGSPRQAPAQQQQSPSRGAGSSPCKPAAGAEGAGAGDGEGAAGGAEAGHMWPRQQRFAGFGRVQPQLTVEFDIQRLELRHSSGGWSAAGGRRGGG